MFAQQVCMNISQKKTDAIMLNVPNPSPVKVNGKDLPKTEELAYLVSTARLHGGAGSDIWIRLIEARKAFGTLNNVWKSPHGSTKPESGMENEVFLPGFQNLQGNLSGKLQD